MAHSYSDTHAARHAAGKTYLEKCAAEDAARIQEMRQKSADELLNVQTNGASAKQDAGRMKMKSRARKAKPSKNPKQKATSKRLKSKASRVKGSKRKPSGKNPKKIK